MSKTLVKPTLKYKIKELMGKNTATQNALIGKKVIVRAGITKASHSRYINLEFDSTSDIPSSVLKIYADLLNVEMEDLFNK